MISRERKATTSRRAKAHVSATYKKIIVSVPDAPVAVNIPDTMSFYVDTRFTTAQVVRMRQMITLLNQWFTHFNKLNVQLELQDYPLMSSQFRVRTSRKGSVIDRAARLAGKIVFGYAI